MNEQNTITLPMPPFVFVCFECLIIEVVEDKPLYCNNCGGEHTFHRYRLDEETKVG